MWTRTSHLCKARPRDGTHLISSLSASAGASSLIFLISENYASPALSCPNMGSPPLLQKEKRIRRLTNHGARN